MTEPLVNFLVIGAQKAGTTALYEYLRLHPHVQLPDIKEVHYFDDESRDWAAVDHADYHARFGHEAKRPARGEVTPIYIYWPESLQRIRNYNPSMKLVLLLRDPVERAWSHWRMERGRGVETEAFSWCIREGRKRLEVATPAGFHREFSYVERGFYAAQIEALLELFPREQLLIQSAERLDADPNGVLAQLSAFLGVAPPPRVARQRVHVGTAELGERPPAEDVEYLQALYRDDDARLQALAGFSFGSATPRL